MNPRDPDPRGPATGRPPGDAPQFSAPWPGPGWAAGSGDPARPDFDPTAPMTRPGGGPRGPQGSPPSAGGAGPRPGDRDRPGGGPPPPFRPRRRLGPTLITAGVLLLALLVIGGATLIAQYHDQHASASAKPGQSDGPAGASTPTGSTGPTGSRAATPSGNSIAFESDEATGTLTVLNHQWSAGGSPQPANGAYLAIEVQLSVDHGSLFYTPIVFQAFDNSGNVYDNDQRTQRRPLLGTGSVSAGQQVRGWIDFDIKRGDTTLLLAGSDSDPIAALKVKG